MSHRFAIAFAFLPLLPVFVPMPHHENRPVTSRAQGAAKRAVRTLLSVTRGTEHECGLTVEGHAYCWGSNRLGQLGDGGVAPRAAGEVAVATAAVFVSLSAGANHTCGLTREGVVYCWGLNLTGELGQALVANICDGFPCNRRPVRVETQVRFDTLSAGFGHTCGLSGGRAFCWGRNDRGQLGSSRADDFCDGVACNVSPVRVADIDTFTSVSAGGDHTCGLAGGVAYCWGSNQYGQLGSDSTVRNSARPLRIPGAERVASIEARGIRTCVTTESGRRACWGVAPYR